MSHSKKVICFKDIIYIYLLASIKHKLMKNWDFIHLIYNIDFIYKNLLLKLND